jgi:hypothetical protein
MTTASHENIYRFAWSEGRKEFARFVHATSEADAWRRFWIYVDSHWCPYGTHPRPEPAITHRWED